MTGWLPTAQLRWVVRYMQLPAGMGEGSVFSDVFGSAFKNVRETVLQQLWRSDIGAEEWRDVPTAEERK